MTAALHCPAPAHPRIPPWHRPMSRGPGEVQFGTMPGGPIVSGISEAEATLLGLLDGTMSLEASYAAAGRAGVSGLRWRHLLELLGRLGLLGAPPGHEGGQTLLVDGHGPLVDEVRALLRRAGVRTDLAGEQAEQPGTAVALLVEPLAIDPQRGERWRRAGVPHLPVVANGPQATVGPLVRPDTGPCLWCLDLHRADRDDAWPVLMAQRAIPGQPIVRPPVAPSHVDPAVCQIVAGTIALFLEAGRAGHEPPVGVSVDIRGPWPRMDHRRWVVHPHCDHHPAGHLLPAAS